MNFITKSKLIHKKYPNLLVAFFFLSGFIFDVSTLGHIDETSNFISHSLYLCLLVCSYIYLEYEFKKPWLQKVALYRRDLFHFISGGLLSGFAIFFFKSSSLSSSSMFIFIILLILLANESSIFQSKGSIVKLSLVQFCISSYFIIYIPVLVGSSGTAIFLLTIVLASVILPIVLTRLRHPTVNDSKIISACMTLLLIIGYFTNIIPPVPLSIKTINVYHKVIKRGNSYELYSEDSFINYFGLQSNSFKAQKNDRIYIFTRIFAPKGFKEDLYVQWEKWDNTWLVSDRIPLSIQGGSNWGYRAYTYKENYSPGLWRAKVMSSDNREIGRVNFTITLVKETKRNWQIKLEN